MFDENKIETLASTADWAISLVGFTKESTIELIKVLVDKGMRHRNYSGSFMSYEETLRIMEGWANRGVVSHLCIHSENVGRLAGKLFYANEHRTVFILKDLLKKELTYGRLLEMFLKKHRKWSAFNRVKTHNFDTTGHASCFVGAWFDSNKTLDKEAIGGYIGWKENWRELSHKWGKMLLDLKIDGAKRVKLDDIVKQKGEK